MTTDPDIDSPTQEPDGPSPDPGRRDLTARAWLRGEHPLSPARACLNCGDLIPAFWFLCSACREIGGALYGV